MTDSKALTYDERMNRLDALMQQSIEDRKRHRAEINKMFEEFEAKYLNK